MPERLVVKVGNADAVELRNYRNPDTDAIESVWARVEGERTTTIQLEEGLDPMQQMATVIRFLQEMMTPGARPWWIECDDESLRVMLCTHYGIPVSRTRPAMWGDGTTIQPPPPVEGKGGGKRARKASTEEETS